MPGSNSASEKTNAQSHPFFDSRIADLFREPTTQAETVKQLAALRHALLSVIQDLAVMKQVLQDANLVTQERYKQLRIQRMELDQAEIGPSPWEAHSYYSHLQDASSYLADSLGCSSAEVADFNERANRARTMT